MTPKPERFRVVIMSGDPVVMGTVTVEASDEEDARKRIQKALAATTNIWKESECVR